MKKRQQNKWAIGYRLCIIYIIHCTLYITLISCSPDEKKLPIYGERDTAERVMNGKTVTDTIYNTIPNFKFVSQNNDTITTKNFDNVIYIADFFFVSCPTICPVMKRNMLKVYKQIKGQNDIKILSHTIDPEHDTPTVLKKYATDLGVNGTQWLFVTGKKEDIYKIGQKNYMVVANEDSTAVGGYIHSGAFILVDKKKQVRGVYDGTNEEGIEKLMIDIEILRKEYR